MMNPYPDVVERLERENEKLRTGLLIIHARIKQQGPDAFGSLMLNQIRETLNMDDFQIEQELRRRI